MNGLDLMQRYLRLINKMNNINSMLEYQKQLLYINTQQNISNSSKILYSIKSL